MMVERGCGRTILSGGEACFIRALPLFYIGFALVLYWLCPCFILALPLFYIGFASVFILALPLLPALTALLHLYQLYVEDEC